jgi:hypothetical protein
VEVERVLDRDPHRLLLGKVFHAESSVGGGLLGAAIAA